MLKLIKTIIKLIKKGVYMERLKKTIGLFLFIFIQILFFVFPFSIGKANNGFEDCWANINNLYEQFVIILFYIFFYIKLFCILCLLCLNLSYKTMTPFSNYKYGNYLIDVFKPKCVNEKKSILFQAFSRRLIY